MHTEPEARKTWCPFARHGDRANNRHGIGENSDELPQYARCIGSLCAAWRWSEPSPGPRTYIRRELSDWIEGLSPSEREIHKHNPLRGFEDAYKHEPKRPQAVGDDWEYVLDLEEELAAFWIEPKGRTIERRKGYCGLAGKPQYR